MIYKACKPVYIKDFFHNPLPQNQHSEYFSSSPVLSLQVLNQDLCNVGLDIFLITMKSLEPVHILHILYHHSITVVHFMLYNLGCITTELAVVSAQNFHSNNPLLFLCILCNYELHPMKDSPLL